MKHYFYMASRDPASSNGSRHLYRQAAALAAQGAEVHLYLVQNGVFGAREGLAGTLRELLDSGVRVSADEFSLRERGIPADELADFVTPLGMDEWASRVLSRNGARLIWH